MHLFLVKFRDFLLFLYHYLKRVENFLRIFMLSLMNIFCKVFFINVRFRDFLRKLGIKHGSKSEFKSNKTSKSMYMLPCCYYACSQYDPLICQYFQMAVDTRNNNIPKYDKILVYIG